MTLYIPLHVLQLIPALHEGGTEQGAVDMARTIRARGGVSVVTSAGGRWADILEAEGIQHITLPLNSKNPLIMLWNVVRIWRVIQKYDIHIVHARSRAPAWSGWLACKLINCRRVFFITTFHGTYGAGNVFKQWYNCVMLKGPLVIANSTFIARHIVGIYGYPADRVVVAERGVDTTVFSPDLYPLEAQANIRKELQVKGPTPLLLMVGRLTRWKGQSVLLEALATLKDIPWVVAFAGTAKNPSYLKELQTLAARLGLTERIRWLGARTDIPLLNIMADVALSCSVEPEAFGRAAIEAMAMETPIIASAHGGSLETVVDGQTGWLVPAGDVVALAKALRKALASPQRLAAMGKVGRKRVLARFTSQHTCEAEWGAYERMIAGHTATGGWVKPPAKP